MEERKSIFYYIFYYYIINLEIIKTFISKDFIIKHSMKDQSFLANGDFIK